MKKVLSSEAKPPSIAENSRPHRTEPAPHGKTGSIVPAGGPLTVDLALVEALRDQARQDAESAARGKAYSAAANWSAWADAFDHLIVTVRSQS